MNRRAGHRGGPGPRAALRVATALATTMLLAGCAGAPRLPATQAGAGAVAGVPQPQVRREWRFEADGVVFDNHLPAARLSDVERLGEGRYRLHIAPEVHPVNPSPWYGLRVRSEAPQTLALEFAYAYGHRHRYRPVTSVDGVTWRGADDAMVTLEGAGAPVLHLEVDARGVRVFAQPPLLPHEVHAWAADIAGRVGGRLHAFGASVRGSPLWALEFGAGPGAPVLLVLGRQHPPENTGSEALRAFVDALAGDPPQARALRRRARVLVLPLLNPDGVVEGHWRGNANGVDLNRDWGPFTQPETRAVRDFLDAALGDERRIAFAIDFHSTHRDVFYTVAEDPSRAPGGMLHGWMAAMQARFPGRIEERAFAATSPVFKNWAYCRFGAPAVTYEVGDHTPAAVLDEVARHAADVLMTLPGGLVRPAAPAPACSPRPASGAAETGDSGAGRADIR